MLVARSMLVMLGLLALAGCTPKKDKPAVIATGVVNIGPASDFPAGSANTRFLDRYGIVVSNSSGTPLAIRPQCTHAAAAVKWNPKIEQFECPAHGCRYDLLGRVTGGPAKRPLPAVTATRAPDNTLTVDLTKLYGM